MDVVQQAALLMKVLPMRTVRAGVGLAQPQMGGPKGRQVLRLGARPDLALALGGGCHGGNHETRTIEVAAWKFVHRPTNLVGGGLAICNWWANSKKD